MAHLNDYQIKHQDDNSIIIVRQPRKYHVPASQAKKLLSKITLADDADEAIEKFLRRHA